MGGVRGYIPEGIYRSSRLHGGCGERYRRLKECEVCERFRMVGLSLAAEVRVCVEKHHHP